MYGNWYQEVVEATAKAEVLEGIYSWRIPGRIRPYYKYPILPTPRQIIDYGGKEWIYNRIRKGLDIEERLKPWTSDYIYGLFLSECFSKYDYSGIYLVKARYPELYVDLQEIHISIASKVYQMSWGECLRIGMFPAAYLPPETGNGPRVIAGLLAGGLYWEGEIHEFAKEEWILLPNKPRILELLEEWGIAFYPGVKIRGQAYISVSPFYAALFSPYMSKWSSKRAISFQYPALCPLMAVIYWDHGFSRIKGHRMLPCKNALPYGCSIRTIRRRKWNRKILHEKAVGLGVMDIRDNLREILEEWIKEYWEEAHKYLKKN